MTRTRTAKCPDTDYNVVVFENRFPSMVRVPGVSEDVTYVDGNPLWEKKLAAGRCEVICFDPNEDGLPADLPVSRLRTVVEAWAFRTAEISKMEGIEQIFPFENHGQEIGVSLAHPHGQVYCYPFIAPKMEKELQHTEAYHEKTGGNLLKDIMNAELEAGERIVMRNHSWSPTCRPPPVGPLKSTWLRCATCSPSTSSTTKNAGTSPPCTRTS